MREKIYLKMLEIAARNPGKSWSIKEIVEELKKTYGAYKFDEDEYICYWFREHFYTDRGFGTPRAGKFSRYKDQVEDPGGNWTDAKMFFKTESYYSFIETTELKESREASLKAQRDAKIAIIIAIITLLVSTGFQIYGLFC